MIEFDAFEQIFDVKRRRIVQLGAAKSQGCMHEKPGKQRVTA
jgi:hypothetical protein